jgi:hypothetical protein
MYRNASTLQEQKGSGTESVNVPRAGAWVERQQVRTADYQQSRCHRVPMPCAVNPRRISGFWLLDPGCAWGMQTFAETTPAAATCKALHSTFVPRFFLYASGIFPRLETHQTNPGAGARASLALEGAGWLDLAGLTWLA